VARLGQAGLQQVKSARRRRAGPGGNYLSPCSIYHPRTSIQLVLLAAADHRQAAAIMLTVSWMRAAGGQHGAPASNMDPAGPPWPCPMHACAYSSAHTVVIYHAPPRTGRPASSVAGGGRRRAEDDDKRKPPRRTYSRLVAIGCRCRPAREITHSAWTHAVNRHAAAVVLQLASSLRFFCFAWLVG
jgi:hypothetical protein